MCTGKPSTKSKLKIEYPLLFRLKLLEVVSTIAVEGRNSWKWELLSSVVHPREEKSLIRKTTRSCEVETTAVNCFSWGYDETRVK